MSENKNPESTPARGPVPKAAKPAAKAPACDPQVRGGKGRGPGGLGAIRKRGRGGRGASR